MAPSEKTFELNTTHEMLRIADQFWAYMQFATATPTVVQACPCTRPLQLPTRMQPPTAFGLSLDDESRQGWDVKIEVPVVFGPRSRALFLQFKRPYPKRFSTLDGLFNGNRWNPNPFVVFGINNNTRKDQHVLLRALANNPGLGQSVLYALPRLPTTKAFKAWSGRTLLMTSFLSVRQLDQMATAKSVQISRGGDHSLRTSYCGTRTELHSELVELSEVHDAKSAVVAEIVAFRVWRALKTWATTIGEFWGPYDFDQVAWPALMSLYFADLARYWGCSVPTVEALGLGKLLDSEDYDSVEDAARQVATLEHVTLTELFDGTEDAVRNAAHALKDGRTRCFAEIVHALMPVLELLKDPRWPMRKIPEPEPRHLTALGTGDNLISPDVRAVTLNPDEADFNSVHFALL